jgi:hypothetical protein
MTPASPATATGTLRLTVVPSPIWPARRYPPSTSPWNQSTSHMNGSVLEAICTTLRLGTTAGTGRNSPIPSPSFPDRRSPTHCTDPLCCNTHVKLCSDTDCSNICETHRQDRCRPVCKRAVTKLAHSSCSPQHFTVPPGNNAHKSVSTSPTTTQHQSNQTPQPASDESVVVPSPNWP